MIRFSLACDSGHAFEAWFRNGEDFEKQKDARLVSCPSCGSFEVNKALMAPSVSTGRKKEKIALAIGEQQKQALEQLKELSKKVRDNAEYVGDKFAEEARKIHFGETEKRGIYGEANLEEVKELSDEGVDILPLPVFPDEQN